MSDRKISQVAKELIAAKKRIENPENWCQGEYGDGLSVCALGAIEAVTPGGIWAEFSQSGQALEGACLALFDIPKTEAPIPWVNDQRGHAAILKCFDHAIATEIQKANAS